jgi:hypothetical protein
MCRPIRRLSPSTCIATLREDTLANVVTAACVMAAGDLAGRGVYCYSFIHHLYKPP